MDLGKIKENVVVTNNGCWEWQKSCCGSGYGQLTIDGKYWSSHRYAYQAFGGNIDEIVVRHTCHNKLCCNPEHLKGGSHTDNWQDSENRHRSNYRKRSKSWSINGVTYDSLRQASNKTGISSHSLCKYTKDGIFDTKAYTKGCVVAGWIPKI